ncbi:MAG: peptide chain release factor 2 [Candidatus Bipolaricaulis sp.]|nr:peptide chain release factor 2 [Candidatus Bipolaricaulis sp.]MDD5219110.1 peptide chain release factor 2 [Candidatus Bipolaricaulis sp.]MDD5647057.1 peptide chain release factor 2 [Candidatus Bipolaricaulis sp.]
MDQESIASLRRDLSKIGEHLDCPAIEREIAELEARMSEPGFWEKRETSAEAARTLEQLRGLLGRYRGAEKEFDEIDVLHSMALEAGDDAELLSLGRRVAALDATLRRFKIELTFSGEHDVSDCYLSINAGAGGTDSQDWAEMLLRMYGRFCERMGFSATLLEVSPGDTAGIRSATLEVKGKYAYGNLKGEAGVHRLVRLSPFDAAHRRHTSFAAVSAIPEIEEVALDIDPKDLRIDTYRSSGAGGQHVNVTDSAVRITHLPTGIVASCQNERSQHQNKETAMRILTSHLVERLAKERADKLEELQGERKENEWGSQIRSYVLHPYRLAKDHRTLVETGNVDDVLDGDLLPFVEAYLQSAGAGGGS